MRGLIPALLLQDLTRRIHHLDMWRWRRWPFRGNPPHPRAPGELFDIMAGTSSGALLTLGLSMPNALTPREVVELYRARAAEIFPPGRFAAAGAMKQAFTVKFDAAPLETLLLDLFGETRLGDCRNNLLVAAYDTDHRSPFFFKSYNTRVCRERPHLCGESGQYRNFLLRDVARATSAAPTFFEPARVTATDGKQYTLVDGGLVANNPALAAYVEARKIYRNARKYIIVSLGTGRSNRQYSWDLIRRWGYLDWVSPLHGAPLNAMFTDGQSEVVAHSLKQLPRVAYFRFNADLPVSVKEEMDDCTPENIAAVESMGRQMVTRFSGELHRLARLLYRHRLR